MKQTKKQQRSKIKAKRNRTTRSHFQASRGNTGNRVFNEIIKPAAEGKVTKLGKETFNMSNLSKVIGSMNEKSKKDLIKKHNFTVEKIRGDCAKVLSEIIRIHGLFPAIKAAYLKAGLTEEELKNNEEALINFNLAVVKFLNLAGEIDTKIREKTGLTIDELNESIYLDETLNPLVIELYTESMGMLTDGFGWTVEQLDKHGEKFKQEYERLVKEFIEEGKYPESEYSYRTHVKEVIKFVKENRELIDKNEGDKNEENIEKTSEELHPQDQTE